MELIEDLKLLSEKAKGKRKAMEVEVKDEDTDQRNITRPVTGGMASKEFWKMQELWGTKFTKKDKKGKPEASGSKPPARKRFKAKPLKVEAAHDFNEVVVKGLVSYEIENRRKIHDAEQALKIAKAKIAALHPDEKNTLIHRASLVEFHAELATTEHRKVYQRSLFAGAYKAENPDAKIDSTTVWTKKAIQYGRTAIHADWGDELYHPRKVVIPGHQKPSTRFSRNAQGNWEMKPKPEELEVDEDGENNEDDEDDDIEPGENDLELVKKLDRMEEFAIEVSTSLNLATSQTKHEDIEFAYNLCQGMDWMEVANRLTRLLASWVDNNTQMLGAGAVSTSDSTDLATLVDNARSDNSRGHLHEFKRAWNLIALAIGVENEYNAYRQGGWRTDRTLVKPLNYSQWNTQWKRNMEASDKDNGLHQINWTESLNQGRRWREWCNLLSGGDGPAYRGGLLALLMLHTDRGTSAWSICRKKLKTQQFEFVKYYINQHLVNFKNFARSLNKLGPILYQHGRLTTQHTTTLQSELSFLESYSRSEVQGSRLSIVGHQRLQLTPGEDGEEESLSV